MEKESKTEETNGWEIKTKTETMTQIVGDYSYELSVSEANGSKTDFQMRVTKTETNELVGIFGYNPSELGSGYPEISVRIAFNLSKEDRIAITDMFMNSITNN